jgi:transcriptional regulator with XRE-family HTH domain
MVIDKSIFRITMNFATILANLRKEKGLTQQVLADRVEVHVTQIRRYEAGTSVPTLDVLRNLATSLNVSCDSLVFGDDERKPSDDLLLAFEATKHLDESEREMLKGLIEAVLLKHEAKRWTKVH